MCQKIVINPHDIIEWKDIYIDGDQQDLLTLYMISDNSLIAKYVNGFVRIIYKSDNIKAYNLLIDDSIDAKRTRAQKLARKILLDELKLEELTNENYNHGTSMVIRRDGSINYE